MTANFKAQSIENMEALLSYQPNRPILVSEFWPGWFDHWFEPIHNTLSLNGFTEILTNIFNYNASVNFYMFHGGTNFGFFNGGNAIEVFPWDAFDVTSYDYGAPLSECGNYTDKYHSAVAMIEKYDPLSKVLAKPDPPQYVEPVAYSEVTFDRFLPYYQIVANAVSSATYL